MSTWWPSIVIVAAWLTVFIGVITALKHHHRRETVVQMTEAEKYNQARKVARKKLLASLNDKQREQLASEGYFDVTSNLGNTFRLRASGHMGNILRVPNQLAFRQLAAGLPAPHGTAFCCHLYGYGEQYPEEDHLLAQALLIRTDEVAFRRTARSI
jgi:hypothetical protein